MDNNLRDDIRLYKKGKVFFKCEIITKDGVALQFKCNDFESEEHKSRFLKWLKYEGLSLR